MGQEDGRVRGVLEMQVGREDPRGSQDAGEAAGTGALVGSAGGPWADEPARRARGRAASRMLDPNRAGGGERRYCLKDKA